MGGFPCAALCAFACDLPCAPRFVFDDGVGSVDVALLSVGADVEVVDDATMLSAVDVAEDTVVATAIDEAAESVDVAAT